MKKIIGIFAIIALLFTTVSCGNFGCTRTTEDVEETVVEVCDSTVVDTPVDSLVVE